MFPYTLKLIQEIKSNLNCEKDELIGVTTHQQSNLSQNDSSKNNEDDKII